MVWVRGVRLAARLVFSLPRVKRTPFELKGVPRDQTHSTALGVCVAAMGLPTSNERSNLSACARRPQLTNRETRTTIQASCKRAARGSTRAPVCNLNLVLGSRGASTERKDTSMAGW